MTNKLLDEIWPDGFLVVRQGCVGMDCIAHILLLGGMIE